MLLIRFCRGEGKVGDCSEESLDDEGERVPNVEQKKTGFTREGRYIF